jgi:hypothetical protein
VDWPAKIFGALGLTMIAVGLVPPYIDIYKEKRVRGFSFIFLMVDMGGAFFSLLSLCNLALPKHVPDRLVFEKFDPLAATTYIVSKRNAFGTDNRSFLSWKPGFSYAIGISCSNLFCRDGDEKHPKVVLRYQKCQRLRQGLMLNREPYREPIR